MTSSIVWSQCTIHVDSYSDGCKVYTKQQRIDCLKCKSDLLAADSTIMSKDSIILEQREFIERTEVKLVYLDKQLAESNDALQDMKKKRRRAYGIGAGIGAGGVLLAEILIYLGIK